MLTIDKVIYNPPATIVLWNDGTKTMAKCDDEDTYNKATGFMLCVLKKKYGNKDVKRMFDKYVYDIPKQNTKGAVVVHTHNASPRPITTKKRVKAKRPTYKLVWCNTEEEPDILEEIYNLFQTL